MRRLIPLIFFPLLLLILLGLRPHSSPAFAQGVQQLNLFLVVTSTPDEEGRIVHIVQEGESIFVIAQAYGLTEFQLLSMNGLTQESTIFPGDRLLIRAALSPTPTAEVTSTPTPTRTERPTATVTRTAVVVPTGAATEIPSTPTPTPEPESSFELPVDIKGDPLLWAIGALALTGAIMMGVGGFLKRKG
jgi:LysM repeat protein